MIRLRPAIGLALCAMAGPVLADPEGDRAAFEACVAETWAAEQGNVMAEAMIPGICGLDTFDMRQSCGFFGYMTPTGMEECLTQDRALWSDIFGQEEAAALATGRGGRSALHDSGLTRCAQEPEGVPRLSCEVEIYWRSVMSFYAAPILFGGSETSEDDDASK